MRQSTSHRIQLGAFIALAFTLCRAESCHRNVDSVGMGPLPDPSTETPPLKLSLNTTPHGERQGAVMVVDVLPQQRVVVTASAEGGVIRANDTYTYQWQGPGVAADPQRPNQVELYPLSDLSASVTVRDSAGNSATATVQIHVVRNLSDFSVTASADPAGQVAAGTVVTLRAEGHNGTPGYTYRWLGGDSGPAIQNPDQQAVQVRVDRSSTFRVKGKDAEGHEAMAEVAIQVPTAQPSFYLEIEAPIPPQEAHGTYDFIASGFLNGRAVGIAEERAATLNVSASQAVRSYEWGLHFYGETMPSDASSIYDLRFEGDTVALGGRITRTFSQAGWYSAGVRVTDANGGVAVSQPLFFELR